MPDKVWKDLKGSADLTLGEGDSVCEEAGVILVDRRNFSGVPSARATKPMTLEIAAVETINIGVFSQNARLLFLDRWLGIGFDHHYSGGTFDVATAKGASIGACHFKNVLNETDAAQTGVFRSYSAILCMNMAATPYYDGVAPGK